MCASMEQLTATTLDDLFEVKLSEQGSTRRQEETRALAFWRDYLLDTEGLFKLQQLFSSFSSSLNECSLKNIF